MVKDLLRRSGRRLVDRVAPTWRARQLPGVVGRVHKNDAMLFDESEESIQHYLRAAESALENVAKALKLGDKRFENVESCLDFGCGHGRVLRYLALKIPPAKITGADVDAEGVGFCAAEFGVKPLVSDWDIALIRLGTYDLIWSGSVFTHLDGPSCDALFGKLAGSLGPGGILVFSMHGEHSLNGLDHLYGGCYREEAEKIRWEVASQGVSFRLYDDTFGDFPGRYGMTWHRKEFFEEKAAELFGDRLKLIMLEHHGWDRHHDVLAFQRR